MNCGQNGCKELATKIIYWPGQTTYQCDKCAEKVVALGKFMGVKVDTSPITVIK